jgi:hypothetical protein
MSAAAQDMQQKAFTRWVNISLGSRGRHVDNLFEDLKVSRKKKKKKKEKKKKSEFSRRNSHQTRNLGWIEFDQFG